MKNSTTKNYSLTGGDLNPIISPYHEYHELLREIASDLANNLAGLVKKAEDIAPKLRQVLPIFSVRGGDASGVRITAVDAGSNGKDLLLGYQPVSLAVGATFLGTNKLGNPIVATVKPPKSYFDDEEGSKFSSLLGYYLMYKVAETLLDETDMVVLDGPLYLPRNYYGPRGRAHSPAYFEVYDAALRSLGILLTRARASGKVVLGVVKRIRSSYVSSWLGLDGLPDSLLASNLLREGEALGPIPMSPRWEDVLPWLDDASRYRPWAIFVRKGAKPFRMDLPEYALDKAEKISNVLYSISEPSSGLPIPLVAVDRLSKLTDRQASLIYKLMMSEISSKFGGSPDRTAIFSLQRGEIE